MLPTQISTLNPTKMPLAPNLRKPFDYKSARDYVVVTIMSVPLVVLSIFGVLYLMQIFNFPQ